METFQTMDPSQAWQPAQFKKWDLRQAGHLYRRAAFGFPPSRADETAWQALQERVKQGPEACLDELLVKPPSEAPSPTDRLLDRLGERIATENELHKLQGWWLYRMVYTQRPLEERATLLWHNHFATSVDKVVSLRHMLRQNQLFRRHALGHFPDLLTAIGRDPAMIIWLDTQKNVKGRPNENYAREVMELFSLGVGNYTEQDIREAARAFTGFTLREGQFYFNASLHDDGPKTIFGQRGDFGGDDVARLILERPAAAMFIAGKLFREFVADEDPPPALLEPLAKQLRETNYDIHQALSTLLRSQLFFSPAAYRARIKSPVEYVVGLLRVFESGIHFESVAETLESLGQSLFVPTNVKGWDGGPQWLNSATIIARQNLAWEFVQGIYGDSDAEKRLHAMAPHNIKSPSQQLALACDLFLQGDVAPQVRKRLMSLAQPSEGSVKPINELVHLVLTLPEYQLA